MAKVLFAWVGAADIRCSKGVEVRGVGPIADALAARPFDRIELLSNWREGDELTPVDARRFVKWLRQFSPAPARLQHVQLPSPMDYGAIYRAASQLVREVVEADRGAELTFHISPGTSAMAAVWILLAKARFRAHLLQSSLQKGVETTVVPFEISADFNPELLRGPDEDLVRLTAGLPPEAPEFDAIVHRCGEMKRLVARARRLAQRDVPVLILGESGTGKEMLARALHAAGRRSAGPLVPVNCGAIPESLVESELFGHAKGAFTGAATDRKGYFEAADGGTLFLDEIGDLQPATQVRLLRVLQEGRVTRVGETRERPIDVRVISATHRDLPGDMGAGRFREDLFHRIAVGVLQVPALRHRGDDLDLLIDGLLEELSKEAAAQPDFVPRQLSPGARARLHQHDWPGNVRELRNTLLRALIAASGATISRTDVEEALLPIRRPQAAGILGRPLDGPLDLQGLLGEVARHYLERALAQSAGNKSEAARILGFRNATTFSNWLGKHKAPRPLRGSAVSRA